MTNRAESVGPSFGTLPHADLMPAVLAAAPWHTCPSGTTTRDEVIAHVVACLGAEDVELFDRPEAGMHLVADEISRVSWVRRLVGDAAADLAASEAASRPIPHGDSEQLDRLVALLLLGARALEVNGAARRMSASRFVRLANAGPRSLSHFWVEKVRVNTKGSGFAQGAVTRALVDWLLAPAGDLDGAVAALADQRTVERLSAVADAERASYLARRTRALVSGDDLTALDALRETLGRVGVPAPRRAGGGADGETRRFDLSDGADLAAMERIAGAILASRCSSWARKDHDLRDMVSERSFGLAHDAGRPLTEPEFRRIVHRVVTAELEFASSDRFGAATDEWRSVLDPEDPAVNGLVTGGPGTVPGVPAPRTAEVRRRLGEMAAAGDEFAALALDAIRSAGAILPQDSREGVSTRLESWLDARLGTVASNAERVERMRQLVAALTRAVGAGERDE